jgi:hypothetical protein
VPRMSNKPLWLVVIGACKLDECLSPSVVAAITMACLMPRSTVAGSRARYGASSSVVTELGLFRHRIKL